MTTNHIKLCFILLISLACVSALLPVHEGRENAEDMEPADTNGASDSVFDANAVDGDAGQENIETGVSSSRRRRRRWHVHHRHHRHHWHHRHHRWHAHHRHRPHLHHRHRPHLHVPHRHHIHIPHLHIPHRHHIHVPHVHIPHRHHIHVPHIHVTLKTVGDYFKKWGQRFKDLYNAIKEAFSGFRFRLPKVDIGKSIRDGFKKGVDSIKGAMKKLTADRAKASEAKDAKDANTPARRRLLQAGSSLLPTKEEWAAGLGRDEPVADAQLALRAGTQAKWSPPGPGGGYAIVKFGENYGVKQIVTAFCAIIQVVTEPIKAMFNGVMKLITGIIPSWLMKIAVFGGIGALIHHFLFKAFTVGFTFGVTYPWLGTVAEDSFEAGFGLEITDKFLIGKTGCYLGGSSGIAMGSVGGAEVGFAVSVFKHYGNIAGDSFTANIEADICKIFGLPCSLDLGGGIILDNGKGMAKKTFNDCLKVFTGEEEEQSVYTLEMIQTMSKEELEKSILSRAKDFFVNGFGRLKKCLNTIFEQWLGLTLSFSAGADVSLPVAGSFTFDYAFSTDGTSVWTTEAPTHSPNEIDASKLDLKLLKGTATQSSVAHNGPARLAVDGNTDQNYGKGSCTHTSLDAHGIWWKLDLGASKYVASVKVWNREDCCSNRLRGVKVSLDAKNCGTLGAEPTQTVHCNSYGRNLIISRDNNEYLTLCEVEVWGASPTVSYTAARGGNGGSAINSYCKAGHYINLWKVNSGKLVDQIQGRCTDGTWLTKCGNTVALRKSVEAAGKWGSRKMSVRTGSVLDQFNGRGGNGGTKSELDCGADGKITGYRLRCGSMVNKVQLQCTSPM